MNCQKCKQPIIIQPKHKSAGEFKCYKCGHVNKIVQTIYYDESIMNGMSTYGVLVNPKQAQQRYTLTSKTNIIGRSSTCNVVVDRIEHDGKCYISGRHCTIKVEFDIWKGTLRYKISDGEFLGDSNNVKPSTNGTYINDYKLQNSEVIDIPDKCIINLGGADDFILEPYIIPPSTLETYKKSIDCNTENDITE
ncbi:MAG: FHA domain-containing protein [Cytophagaceae bacterium]|nr:FHA domain-containing protein [Cytophagaceae bacterium]